MLAQLKKNYVHVNCLLLRLILVLAIFSHYTHMSHGTGKREGRGLNRVFTHAFLAWLKLTTVFCVHSVIEHQKQQLDLPEAHSWAATDQGKRFGPSWKVAWTVHHYTNLTSQGHSHAWRASVLHCNGDSVYIFLFWEWRGLSPNFHINVSFSNLYIPRISLHISSSRTGRPIVGIYNSLTDTWMWKLGLRPRYSFSGNICFKFSTFCLCSCGSFSSLRPHWL